MSEAGAPGEGRDCAELHDDVGWNPGFSLIDLCPCQGGMQFWQMVCAVSAWYRQSAAHEAWFDPGRRGELELTLGFTDDETPDAGKVRLYRGRAARGLPKTTYFRRFACADLPATIDRSAWVIQIERHQEALRAVGQRHRLPDPPPPPAPEDCLPFMLPVVEAG